MLISWKNYSIILHHRESRSLCYQMYLWAKFTDTPFIYWQFAAYSAITIHVRQSLHPPSKCWFLYSSFPTKTSMTAESEPLWTQRKAVQSHLLDSYPCTSKELTLIILTDWLSIICHQALSNHIHDLSSSWLFTYSFRCPSLLQVNPSTLFFSFPVSKKESHPHNMIVWAWSITPRVRTLDKCVPFICFPGIVCGILTSALQHRSSKTSILLLHMFY